MKEQKLKAKNKTKAMSYTLLMIAVLLSVVVGVSMLSSITLGSEVAKIAVEAKLDKYINYNTDDQIRGTLVQYQVKTKMEYQEDANIPVKDREIEVQFNKIEGKYPEGVKTIAKNTESWNGKTSGIQENCEYSKNSGKLIIRDHEQNIESNISEYIVIAYYDTYAKENPERNLTLDITARATQATEDNVTIDTKTTLENTVTENMGQITSINHKTGEIYNGYIKSNYINGTNYQTQYKETQEITISHKNVQKRLEVVENNTLVKGEEEIGNNGNLVYKSTKINKENVVEILGKKGNITILDGEHHILATIDENTEFEEDGTLTIFYESEPETIIIQTSDIEQEGILTLEHQKEIKSTMTETVNTKIKTRSQINEMQDTVDIIEIKDAKTNVEMTVNNPEWTNKQQNEVTFDLSLNANTEKNNLFKNPTLKIELPEEVEKVVLQNSGIFYANGLELQEVNTRTNENGRIEIVANLTGEQTAYDENALSLTTEIKISATMILKKDIETTEAIAKLICDNQYAVDGNNSTASKELAIHLENYKEQLVPVVEENIDTYQTAKPIEANVEGLKLEVAPIKGDVAVSDGDSIYAGEYIKYNVKVTNTSEKPMEHVKIIGMIPEGTTYGELEADYHNTSGKYQYNLDYELREKEIEIGTLQPGQTITKFYEVQVNELDEEKEITTNIKAQVGETEVANYEIKNVAKQSEIQVFLKANLYNGKNKWYYYINLKSDKTEETEVKVKLPKQFKPQYLFGDLHKIIHYDETNTPEDNILTVKIPSNSQNNYYIGGIIESTSIAEKTEESKIELTATASVEKNGITYHSNENRIMYEYENVSISMTSDTEGEEVKYGEEINYRITIENIGRTNLNQPEYCYIPVKVTDFLPENVKPETITYDNWDIEEKENIVNGEVTGILYTGNYTKVEPITKKLNKTGTDENGNELPNVDLQLTIPYKEKVTIDVKTTAGSVFEKTKVENTATVEDPLIETKTSNIVTHTILPLNYEEPSNPEEPEKPENPEDPSKPTDPSNPTNNKYSISGMAWLDENEDGQRQAGEKGFSGINVMLVDTKNATIIKNGVKTAQNGGYKFTELEKGNYMVLFQYDTNSYRATEYQKVGVSNNANSDAITKEVTLNGETMKVGIIEVSDLQASESNLDIGLIQNKICDFKLDKMITKATVTTKNGTKQYAYNNEKLAKIEIRAKEIEGATVVIEYKIVVTNEGELPSTVGKVIDYLPEGLTFSSELNKNWSAQTGGQLVNTSMSNKKIEPGESVELTLIATKKMTANGTGTFTNGAEIGDITNSLGIKDIDSTPGNKVKTEDDYSEAEVIISVSTGAIVYISLGISFVALVGVGIFLAYKYGILKLGKISLFTLIILATLVAGTTNIQAYTANYSWDGHPGPSDATGFSGGPTGRGYCDTPGAAAHGSCANDSDGSGYYGSGTAFSESTTSTVLEEPTIQLDRLNDEIQMKTVGNDFIFGPFEAQCDRDATYTLIVKDLKGGNISSYTICDANGSSKTLRGSGKLSFYLRIPISSCANGISSVKLKASYTGDLKIRYDTYAKIEFHPGDGCQEVITDGKTRIDSRIETTKKTVEDEIEWTKIRGALEVVKHDEDQKEVKLQGVKIRIQGNGIDQTLTTDANGSIYLDNLPSNVTYTITEIENPNYGYLADATGSVVVKPGMKYVYQLSNIKHTGNLKIEKKDADAGFALAGMGFKIKNAEGKYIIAVDSNGTVQKRPVGTIHLGNLQYTSNESEATEFITDSKGEIKIYNLLTGTYQVIETSVGDNYYGYEIDDDYIAWEVAGGTTGKGKTATVEVTRQKSTETGENSSSQNEDKLIVKNERKYIKLSGYVWVDQVDGKTSERNDLFKDTQSRNQENGELLPDTKDLLFNGISVKLKNKNTGNTIKDKNGNDQKTITAQLNRYKDAGNNGNGEYLFDYVLKREIGNYMVEFEYDGLTYTNVIPHLDKNNGSKSAEGEQRRDEFNKGFTEVNGKTKNTGITKDQNGNEKHSLSYDIKEGQGVDGKPGEATATLNSQGKYEVVNGEYMKQNSIGQYPIIATTKDASYDIKANYVLGQDEVKYINLGLYHRDQPDITLGKDLQSVKIVVNNKAHIYEYDQRYANAGEYTGQGFNVGVKYKNKYTGSYARAIYKADYEYTNNEDPSRELKVYITYKLKMLQANVNLTAQVNSIADYYDSNYELIHAGTGVNDKGEITGILTNETPQSYNDKYKRVVINNQTKLEPQKEQVVYVQYALNREAVIKILNDQENLDNFAEINSYSIFDAKTGKIYAGIDIDSNPGNGVPEDTAYEDDTASSPALKLEVADARELLGKVFLDETSGELMTGQIRQGSGEYEQGEKGIAEVDITLTENSGSGKVYTTKTDENGDFFISNFIPGDYTLTYTWGDKTYTVQDYKSTIYKDQDRQNNAKWYKEKVDTRLSDAMDNYDKDQDAPKGSRQQIDEEIKKVTVDTEAKITRTKMDSTTPTMDIGVEYETNYTASTGDKYVYQIKNVDFGIVERARQDLALNKRIKTLKATLANGQVIANITIEEDENGNRVITGDRNGIAYMKPDPNMVPSNGILKLELDNELIQGTVLEVGYEIKATNQSELDYLSENYYQYGIVEGNVVTIEPTGIIDYLDKNWSFDNTKYPEWEVKTIEQIKDLVAEEVYNSNETTIHDKLILYTEQLKGKKLKPTESAQVEFNVSRVLTTVDEVSFDNEVEITELNKTGGSKPQSTPGNYIPGTTSTETDDSMAETTIVTPATGENLNYIIPIAIGITALLLLGTGVVLIKKKALDK